MSSVDKKIAFKAGDIVKLKYENSLSEVIEVFPDKNKIRLKELDGEYKCIYDITNDIILMSEEDLRNRALVIEEIENKMKKAASYLEKAWDLFSSSKEDSLKIDVSLNPEDINIQEFVETASNFGWRTSSMYC